MTLGRDSNENCSPGIRMNSGMTNPAVASIAARPCLSSASRYQGSHSGDLCSLVEIGSKNEDFVSQRL